MTRLLQVSPADAAAQCRSLEYEDIGGFAKIDTHRFARTGFPEVVYAEGKTNEQVADILQRMVRTGVDANVMATRVTPASADAILALIDVVCLLVLYLEAPLQLDHALRLLTVERMSAVEQELPFYYYPTARILASRDLHASSQNDANKTTQVRRHSSVTCSCISSS